MSSVKVSVIMPVYNAEKYLKQALDTVINQTLSEIEIICVDDGSSDDSWNILSKYAENDSRIKIMKQPLPSDGAALARNLGMTHATGKYLIFLDSDDWFELDMLEKLYEKAEKEKTDIVFFDAWGYNEETKKLSVIPWTIVWKNIPQEEVFSANDCRDVIFDISSGQPWNKLYLRKFIEDFNIRFTKIIPDDQSFSFISYACAQRMTVIKNKFLFYRHNAQGTQTSNMPDHPEAGYMGTEMLFNELKQRDLYETYKVAFVNRAIATAVTFLNFMTNDVQFEKLYNALKYYYFERWGVFSVSHEKLETYRSVFLEQIVNYSALGFLLNDYRLRRRNSQIPSQSTIDKLTIDSNIAIYGAGVRGRQIFNEIFNNERLSVVIWVDKNYDKIGYPVQSPTKLQEIDFDYVVIAIDNRKIYLEVKDYLGSLNIDGNKIVWLFA